MTGHANESDDQPEPSYCEHCCHVLADEFAGMACDACYGPYCEHCGPSGAPCPTCGETLP